MKNKNKLIRFLATGVIASAFLVGCNNEVGTTQSILTQTQPTIVSGEKGLTKENPLNISEAIELCEKNDDKTRYYVYGTIKEISNPLYGQMKIEDNTGIIDVYGSYSADGEKRYSELDEKPKVGDKVLLYATLVTFNGTPEIKSGWIISFEKGVDDFDYSKYSDATVKQAREAQDGSLVKVSGTVAKITYANGLKPSGVYLVDGTNSIYVYDAEVACDVSVGNNITIYGEKTHYIAENESTAANKYGYKGCNQITNCRLTSNDKKVNDIDYSWVEEKSVKEIMETSVSNDITTSIYKVNALITKAPGDGFVNYYINDLDGVTGSYVYTQCNGSDLDYLEEFNGKICTVYLSAINAKSSDSGCIWRFLPISVEDENFTFDLSKTNDFVMEYHVSKLFEAVYEGDPKTELITSISSDLLGFENVLITYSSSNEDVISFANENDKYIMHANQYGKTTVSVSVTYNGKSTTKTFDIEYKQAAEYNTISIEEVYNKEFNEEVIIKGVVAAGVTNQKAFYLVDETGMIAVRTTDESLKKIKLGTEVIVKGIYTNTSGTKVGQLHIEDAIILSVLGSKEYSTSSFTDSTLSQLIKYCDDKNQDSTGKVYVLECEVEETVTQYSSVISLKDKEGNSLQLYCSSSKQYSWLLEYKGLIKVEITTNAWNGKYKGSIIAVILEDGTKICTKGSIEA